MAVFMQEFDALDDDLTQLVGTGLTYGVHVILAANRWMELRPKVRDNIGTRLEFRLNDPADSEFGRKVAGGLPLGIPGRGLNKETLHFQVALPVVDTCTDEEHPSAQQPLEAFVARVREHWAGPTAPPVRLLPALVPWSAMPTPEQEDRRRGLPLGLEELRLEPIFLDLVSQSPHFLILGDSECGKTTLLRTLIRGIEQRYTTEEAGFAIIDYRKMLVDFAESKNLLTYAYNASTVAACVANFKVDLEKRQKTDGDVPLSRRLSPKAWSGRHFFLFVDDYDSLSPSSSNSPLSGLVEYLTTGRDIGFHVIIARRVGGMARSSFEPVVQRMREMGTSAIIMSGDREEGRLLYNQAATILPPGRGYYVRRTHPSTLVQVAFAEAAYVLD